MFCCYFLEFESNKTVFILQNSSGTLRSQHHFQIPQWQYSVGIFIYIFFYFSIFVIFIFLNWQIDIYMVCFVVCDH